MSPTPTRDPVTDVVVLLPGILGSVLMKGEKVLWSSSRTALARNVLLRGQPLEEIALAADHLDGDQPGDGITATALIPDTHMIPGLWTIDGYSKVAGSIRRLPGVRPGENYFEFPYDWRLDNRIAARKLARCGREWLASWRAQHPDARLVLVAHSMGGLVSRYFVEVLGGWQDTRALITIGTPFRGSLQALDFLANGIKRSIGSVSLLDLTEAVRSLPSAYQLLPTYHCWDGGNWEFAALSDAGPIPGVSQKLVAAAREFHTEVEQAAKANATLDEYRQSDYALIPIAGISQPTLQSAKLTGETIGVMRSIDGRDRDGDGRVMREVATPERSQKAWHVNQQHASLQNDASVLTQIQAILSEPRDALRERSPLGIPDECKFGLDLEDAYLAGEPVLVRVPVEGSVPPLTARVTDTANNEEIDSVELREDADSYLGELRPLTRGIYRIAIEGRGLDPVTGLFAVFGRD
jgi:pimeloyl-ACP methyl ester carboxylesterase